ncbi:MAG: hypothetical protein JRG94_14025, partial [Deltaproteobacteria bacterium]|nr:hypothetical protein [Deltaproteobacteria bacterium]
MHLGVAKYVAHRSPPPKAPSRLKAPSPTPLKAPLRLKAPSPTPLRAPSPLKALLRIAPLLLAMSIPVSTAQAFEVFDGRLEAHGFFESQLRVLNEDFSEDWDVAQWYQVLDVEIELDIIDDTWMGVDLLSAFVR